MGKGGGVSGGPTTAAVMKFEGTCCKHANTSQGLTALWMALVALAAGIEMMSGAGKARKSLKLQPSYFSDTKTSQESKFHLHLRRMTERS